MPDEDGGPGAQDRSPADGRVREVALLFLRLGTIGFGGPAAHIALMHDEVVRRRRWVPEQRFLDLVGATNLIPGPNSTELAIHLGYDRARWRGLAAAGVCFILPAALVVTAFAWGYVAYGQTPAVEGPLYGMKPVVFAIIVRALFGLVRTAVSTAWLAVLAAGALAAYLLGGNELGILAGGAGVAFAVHRARRGGPAASGLLALLFLAATLPAATLPAAARVRGAAAGHLPELFLTMLKIGSVLYGSGYVLLAFLRGDFVVRLGWITQQQLLDAVSVGQVTPGPVFTTATFVGYLVAGLPGAVVATIAIFLPSFLFVGLLTRLTDRVRSSPAAGALLDGVNAAALALMAGVSLQLARNALVDPFTVALAAVAGLLVWRTRLNSAWIIAGGAALGLAARLAA